MENTKEERHNPQPRYQLGEKKPSWEPKITDKSILVEGRK